MSGVFAKKEEENRRKKRRHKRAQDPSNAFLLHFLHDEDRIMLFEHFSSRPDYCFTFYSHYPDIL